MSDNIVNVYIDGLPVCRCRSFEREIMLAAREHRILLACSHEADKGQEIVDFLRGCGFNAYLRSGDDRSALCEPYVTGYDDDPVIDWDARWYPA